MKCLIPVCLFAALLLLVLLTGCKSDDNNPVDPGGAIISDSESRYGRIAEGAPSLDAIIRGTDDNCEGYEFAYEGDAASSLSSSSMNSSLSIFTTLPILFFATWHVPTHYRD